MQFGVQSALGAGEAESRKTTRTAETANWKKQADYYAAAADELRARTSAYERLQLALEGIMGSEGAGPAAAPPEGPPGGREADMPDVSPRGRAFPSRPVVPPVAPPPRPTARPYGPTGPQAQAQPPSTDDLLSRIAGDRTSRMFANAFGMRRLGAA